MDYKPADLFVGVIDIFAIFAPGALLSFALSSVVDDVLLCTGCLFPPIPSNTVAAAAIFVFASWLSGHFIFLLGSQLDRLFDPWRRLTKPPEKDRPYRRATELKRTMLSETPQHQIINTFKWAKANVELRNPPAAGQLHRLEADSKFFRSLIVVLGVLAIKSLTLFLFGWTSDGWRTTWEVIGIVFLISLGWWRYADQRWKSIELAYTYLIALEIQAEREHEPDTIRNGRRSSPKT